MSAELRISLFPLSSNVLVYVHVNVGVFTRTPFLPYPVWWCNLNSSVDGWSNCGYLAVFPRHKGRRPNWSLFFLLVALIFNRYVVGYRVTIIPDELGGWLQLFFLSPFFFFFLSQGSLKISFVERFQIRLVFVPHIFFSSITFENIWTFNTWSKVQQDNFLTKRQLSPHRHHLISLLVLNYKPVYVISAALHLTIDRMSQSLTYYATNEPSNPIPKRVLR
jgi:hypothetical protein